MSIKVSVQEVVETATTEAIVVGPDVEVCRVTVVRQVAGGEKTTAVSELVRFTGAPTDETHGPDGYQFGQFVVVEPELVEKIRMTGWPDAGTDYELISKAPFTRVLSEKPFEVVRFKSYDHSLYALDGQRLPVAMVFNYMGGQGSVNDYSFDLKKLLVHLQARADVTLHTERHSDSLIQRVPHYNRGGSSGNYHIEFTWHPNAETFREYLTLRASLKEQWDAKHRAPLTMMGCDEFRIPEREADEDEDEDDHSSFYDDDGDDD